MLTAHERERLMAQSNRDRLVEEWKRARSEANARAIRHVFATLGRVTKQLAARVAGSAATRSPEDPRQGAAAI